MIDSGLPESMWIFAADTTHINNGTPHKTNDFKIPILIINKLKRFR